MILNCLCGCYMLWTLSCAPNGTAVCLLVDLLDLDQGRSLSSGIVWVATCWRLTVWDSPSQRCSVGLRSGHPGGKTARSDPAEGPKTSSGPVQLSWSKYWSNHAGMDQTANPLVVVKKVELFLCKLFVQVLLPMEMSRATFSANEKLHHSVNKKKSARRDKNVKISLIC